MPYLDPFGFEGLFDSIFSSIAGSLILFTIVLPLVFFLAYYIYNGYIIDCIAKKAGLDKSWMAFVPFASTIYRLQTIEEEWYKMFLLGEWYFYSFILFMLLIITSKSLFVFASILVCLYLLACVVYNIYYHYKFYNAFGVNPMVSILILVPGGMLLILIFNSLIAFTKLFTYSKNGVTQSEIRSSVSTVSTGSLTGLNGMYTGQTFKIVSGDELIIGRDSAFSNIILDENASKVSRKHCGIVYDHNRNVYQVTDYSSQGTFNDANGNRLTSNTPNIVQAGTVIYLGSKENRFKLN